MCICLLTVLSMYMFRYFSLFYISCALSVPHGFYVFNGHYFVIVGPSREVEARGVLSSERNAFPDELSSFMDMDTIPASMGEFMEKCRSTSLITDHKPVMYCDVDNFCISFIRDSVVYARVIVNPNFSVSCFSYNTKVNIRDLLGYQCKLEKWSQLEAVICRSKSSPVNLTSELAHHSKLLRHHAGNTTSEITEKVDFLLNQLEIQGNPSRGKSYTAHQVLLAARLYFVSRTGFKQSRRFIALPYPSTIKRYLGGFASGDTLEFAQSLIQNTVEIVRFKHFSVVVDEIHVKPSVWYRGAHVIGKSVDVPNEAAKTVVAVMVKPLADGKSFVARLVPVFNLKPEFLFEQIELVIGLIVAAGGHVDAVVADNHMTNRRCFSMFQQDSEYPWIGYSKAADSSLILLYDTVHLMKSFRNNWIIEGRQRLQLSLPNVDNPVLGQREHVCTIEREERDSPIRCTTLNFLSCHPSPIARQKMKLFLNVLMRKLLQLLKSATRMIRLQSLTSS